ncbi:pseudoazurin [Coralliovum pocilloporae]|uniref:pseudoazurin n=1 Tax=Coralliovum pocilloporae TaxID=3066369 RepID=UPI0033076BF4
MTLLIDRRSLIVGMASLAIARPALAAPTVHEVQMLNKHPDHRKMRNVFYPLIQTVEAGDTVTFLPTNRGHNSASIKGMIPEGAEPWKGKINQEISVTFEKPGIYGYMCTPHVSLGMVGLVIVKGDGVAHNLEAAKAVKQRGKAKRVFKRLWEQVEADGLLAS